ncbi:MAG: LysM peptidoglycan-binding domain-containing protein [bacterium]
MFRHLNRWWFKGFGALAVVSAIHIGCADGTSLLKRNDNVPEEIVPQETVPAETPNRVRPEELLEATPLWMGQADSLLAAGDTSGSEERTMEAILALQSIVFDLPVKAREAVVDTLLQWRSTYEENFGSFAVDMVATDEGVMELLAAQEEDFSTDSLLEVLAPDSFEVVLDPNINEIDRLPDIPDTLNAKVERMVRYLSQNERGRVAMSRWLSRAGEMIPRMAPILRQHGIPEDLVYLSMIESGFREDARSWARAVGPWQFIGSTARIFDLQADWWYDERRDPEQATHAAARFLRQLHEHFGDWYLALAAYNCGEGRIRREIRRNRSTDFWRLNRLPRQTRNYVPTFLAARIIAKDPETYGFPPIVYATAPKHDMVMIHEPVELSALADALQVDLNVLRKLNPSLIRWCTPPNRDSTRVILPEGLGVEFDDAYASIPDDKKTSWTRHKVSNGETLSMIATQYGTTTRAIMDVPANGISNPHLINVNQYLLIPVASSSVQSAAFYAMSDPELPDGYQRRVHTVRRGDTLSQIAERYHVGLSKLLRWNGLSKRSVIRPGQKLVVYPPQPYVASRRVVVPAASIVQTPEPQVKDASLPSSMTAELTRWLLIRDVRSAQPAEELIIHHAPETR